MTPLRLLRSACLLLLACQCSHAFVTKSGNVSGQSWPAGTYQVTGDLTVDVDSTLNLAPGCVIKFNFNTGLRVNGTLLAPGTAENLIIFTGRDDNSVGETLPTSDGTPSPGDWDGIYAYGYSGSQGILWLAHALLRYGGGSAANYQGGLYCQYSDAAEITDCIIESCLGNGARSYTSSPVFRSCQFRGNGGHGLLGSNGGQVCVMDCVFENNAQYGAYLNAIVPASYGGNSGSGNTTNGLGISGTLAGSSAWDANDPGFPYVLLATMTVGSADTLELRPGVVVKCLTSSDVQVDGVLLLAGAAGNPVVLTSIRDDAWGGDTNGDGAATTPAPGDWEGIDVWGYMSSPGLVEADWCILRYGGNSSTSWDANLYFSYADAGHFRNSVSEYSQMAGIRANNSIIDMETSVCHGNLGHGLEGTSANQLTVHACTFTDNGGYGAWLASGVPADLGGNGGGGNGTDGFAISGTTAGSIVWSANQTDFPYILGGAFTVSTEDTLELQPGVIIKGISTAQMNVNGVLKAAGSADSLVVFTSLKDDSWAGDTNGDGTATSPAPGDWYGIYCWGYQSAVGEGDFNWCSLNYGGNSAGYPDANLYFIYSDRAVFQNSQANFSAQSGLRTNVPAELRASLFNGNASAGIATLDGGQPDIHDCVFTNNATIGASLVGNSLGSFGGNSGSGNGINGLGISGTASHETWEPNAADFPYVLIGNVTVAVEDTLWLTPGVLVKGQSGTQLEVDGVLVAIGTGVDPIRFTSLRDDAWGGDSNGDGAATQPVGGDWNGLRCWGHSSNLGMAWMDHFAIRYGGGGGNAANLYLYASDAAGFSNGVITHSSTNGINCIGSSPVIGSCVIENNASYGVLIQSGSPRLGACDDSAGGYNRILGNNSGGFQVRNETVDIVGACYNDWGVYTPQEIDDRLFDNEEAGWGEIRFNPYVLDQGPTTIARVSVSDAGDTVSLYWCPVLNASGYLVHSSTQARQGFSPDGGGVFTGSHWTGPVSGPMRYYQVLVVTE